LDQTARFILKQKNTMQIIIKNEVYEIIVLKPWHLFEITKNGTNTTYRVSLPSERSCPAGGKRCKHLMELEIEAQKQMNAVRAYHHRITVAEAEFLAWDALEKAEVGLTPELLKQAEEAYRHLELTERFQ
jgi:hypothetical protein